MENGDSNEGYDSSLPVEKWCGDDRLYQWKGCWFRLQYLLGTRQVLDKFKPLPSDVILASFPKTGTTWLKSLLYSIINRSSGACLRSNHPHLLVPTLEVQLYGPQQQSFSNFASTSSSSRILATHLPRQILADAVRPADCRVVYVTRNPKDTLTSFWQFVLKSRSYEEPWPLEMAVEKFCNGVVPFGPYYDHVLGFWKESLERPEKVFFITYEELKDDTKTQVKRLAEFLGCPFNGDGEEEVLDEIVMSCSFEKLSSHEVNKSSEHSPWMRLPMSSFFRKGEVGDHRNYLNNEMVERIDAITVEKFHELGLMYGVN
ncbi:cytosolic sulfotransferase [Salix suchowensis]|nr:cytosolic sulfotransferase [Salix suchowensis]KAG5223743.1 cytosolic sulfotransferase [Salix suchowensis]